jgi:hypothetical protein
MRLRILSCVLIVVTVGTILYRCSLPPVPPNPEFPPIGLSAKKSVHLAINPLVIAPEKTAEKTIPKNWSRHKFNDGEFYVVPLACD